MIYQNFGYIRIRARSLRGSFVLHFWVTTPANLDFSHNQFSMRIIRRLSEDSRRDPPHDTSMGPACQFGYFVQFGREDFVTTSRMQFINSVLTCSNFHFVIYFARFTFTGFAFRTSGKTEEATAHSQSTQVSFSTCDVRTTGCDSEGFRELCL